MIWQVSVRLQLGELQLEVDLGGEHGPLALVGPMDRVKPHSFARSLEHIAPNPARFKWVDAQFSTLNGVSISRQRIGMWVTCLKVTAFSLISASSTT